MLQRSGGEMQSWKVLVTVSSLEVYQDLLHRIPKSKARSLYIQVTDEDNYGSYSSNTLFQREFELLANVIMQCSDLISLELWLDSELEFTFGTDVKAHPFAGCRLESLSLHNVSLSSLYRDDSIFDLVSQARQINLSGSDIGTDAEIVRLIDSAKDTLENCSVKLTGTTSYDIDFRSINLPRLRRLRVFNYHGSSSTTGSMQYSLTCPELRHLNLSGSLSPPLCNDLLTSTINTLHLELDEHLCKSTRNILRNCSNLSTLRLAIAHPYQGRFPSELLEEILDELVVLPIKEFVFHSMVQSNLEDEKVILNFFEKRSKEAGLAKMKIFLLHRDIILSQDTLKDLLQYCEVVKSFANDEEDSTYSEGDLKIRSYGRTIGM
ncbi:uncharacterized protein FA14DRAFT_180651 [Meira miltonrushii]|uniref:RNI-like protein n=1 Tax=Meira miltonrushii TaxID=1280837 RepID=A0A316V8U0_9BASI|nr:uncharacterized protein FA14DRAFT_180651 [Meira miltonrushii]PWN34017.1 hypothetical protein FA14DRAFT_180651 [Meira miltonrushii]